MTKWPKTAYPLYTVCQIWINVQYYKRDEEEAWHGDKEDVVYNQILATLFCQYLVEYFEILGYL